MMRVKSTDDLDRHVRQDRPQTVESWLPGASNAGLRR